MFILYVPAVMAIKKKRRFQCKEPHEHNLKVYKKLNKNFVLKPSSEKIAFLHE